MKIKVILILLLMVQSFKGSAQLQTYFNKIEDISTKVHTGSELYYKLDSLKQTRRPEDSYVKVIFNRDIDFGYKHKRIQIVFNSSSSYQINLLLRKDSICLSSTILGNVLDNGENFYTFNHRVNPIIDTPKTVQYLNLRNSFYSSKKSFKELKDDLDNNVIFALRGGDGYLETNYKKHVDTLVSNKNFAELETMLKNINCETQTYGVLGFSLLKSRGVRILSKNQKIINYLKKRNSDIETTQGDLCCYLTKVFK